MHYIQESTEIFRIVVNPAVIIITRSLENTSRGSQLYQFVRLCYELQEKRVSR